MEIRCLEKSKLHGGLLFLYIILTENCLIFDKGRAMDHILCVCVCIGVCGCVCKESLWSCKSHNKHTVLVDYCASDCRTEGERQVSNISGWRITGSIQRLWISRLFPEGVTVAEGVLLFFVSNEWTGDRWICWGPRMWVLQRTGVSVLLEESPMLNIFRHLYLARSWSFPVQPHFLVYWCLQALYRWDPLSRSGAGFPLVPFRSTNFLLQL